MDERMPENATENAKFRFKSKKKSLSLVYVRFFIDPGQIASVSVPKQCSCTRNSPVCSAPATLIRTQNIPIAVVAVSAHMIYTEMSVCVVVKAPVVYIRRVAASMRTQLTMNTTTNACIARTGVVGRCQTVNVIMEQVDETKQKQLNTVLAIFSASRLSLRDAALCCDLDHFMSY